MAPYTLVEIDSNELFTETDHNKPFAAKCHRKFVPDILSGIQEPSRNDRGRTPHDVELAILRIKSWPHHPPKIPGRGWILGRAPQCDIVIGGKMDGVSYMHFEIIPLETPRHFIVKNISDRGTGIMEGEEAEYTRVHTQRFLNPSSKNFRIAVGKIEMELRATADGGRGFGEAWAELHAACLDVNPLGRLNIAAAPASSTHVSRHVLRGSFAKAKDYHIFVAEERDTHSKILLKRYQCHDGAVRAAEEIRILSQLDHENIIKFLDYDQNVGTELALEYVEGNTLLEENSRPASLCEFKLCAQQLLRALAYLHVLDLYHGNLQAENIFVHRNGSGHPSTPGVVPFQIKLANFGNQAKETTNGILGDLRRLLELLVRLILGRHFNSTQDLGNNILGVADSARIFLLLFEDQYNAAVSSPWDLLMAEGLSEDIFFYSGLGNDNILPMPRQSTGTQTEAHVDPIRDIGYVSDDSMPDTEYPDDQSTEVQRHGDTPRSERPRSGAADGRGRQFQMFEQNINGRVVSIRREGSNIELNLSQLLLATDISSSRRAALRKEHSALCVVEDKKYWIPLQDSQCIVRSLGMQQQLDDLYKQALLETDGHLR